jgi:DNA-binding Lrp family transcriptional regulator
LVEAFVLIKVGTSEHLNFAKTAKEEIAKIEGVIKVFGVFGRYDLVAHVQTQNLESLSRVIMDKLRSVPGIVATESLVIGY